MTPIKRWLLLHRLLDEFDIIWLRGLGCYFNTEAKEPIRVMQGNQMHTFSNLYSNQIQIITTTDKQETMLKLKYSNELILVNIVHELCWNE
jgi:hypothetical protein